MPNTSTIAGLEYFGTNSAGHIMSCSFASAPFDTTPNTYGVGCQAVDRSLGDTYSNTGTPTAPVWVKQPKKASVFAQVMVGAFTSALLGTSPVGCSGTITGVRVVNGDTTKGTLVFSKNNVIFACIVKNGTAGAMTGCPLGSATAFNAGCPVGSVSFGPSDVISVQNVGSDVAEVIVDFI